VQRHFAPNGDSARIEPQIVLFLGQIQRFGNLAERSLELAGNGFLGRIVVLLTFQK